MKHIAKMTNISGYIRNIAARNCRPLLIGLLLMFFAAPQLASAGIQQIGHLGNGNSFDLAEANGYLYVGQGTEIRTYDVSSDSKIAQLNWKDYTSKIDLESLVRGVSIDSNYLYVASDNRFTILDISNPSKPSVISYITPPASKYAELRDVKIKGNYAYIAGYEAGVLVVDISNKANPVLVTTLKLSGYNRPWRLDISGNYLYVAVANNNRLDIIDISNPQNPVVKGSWSANAGTNSFSGVAVKGNYAYVTEYYNGVHVLDISNPANPTQVTSLMGMNANDIQILGNYAYVSVRYQGFNILDISNPSKISIVGQGTGISGYIEGIFPTSKYTFLAAESKGFAIYDTSSITKPGMIVQVPVVGGSDSVAVKGNYLYVGAHNDGTWVVDVSNPAKPEEVAFANYSGRNEGIEIQGNYLYAASDWGGLNIIDITNPANPVLAAQRYGDSTDGSVLPDGNYLYTSIYYPSKSLGIVNIANPTNPAYVSKSMNISTARFAKYGSNYVVAAAAGGAKGLQIFDVSDKTKPVLVSALDSGVVYKDVAVNGNVAVALTGNSLITYDISNPAKPTVLGKASYSGQWTGYAVDVNNNIAYAAGGDVRAFDIKDPSNIKLIGTYNLPEVAYDIRYSDGKIYVADYKEGVYVLSLNGDNTPSPSPSPAQTATSKPAVAPAPTSTPKPTVTPVQTVTPKPATTAPSASGTIYYTTNVESGKAGWRLSGLWQLSDKNYHSSSHSFYYGDERHNSYYTGKANSGNLISPEIDLSGSSKPVLNFYSWYQTRSDKNLDTKTVQISINYGSWQTIAQIDHTQNTWVQQSIDLSSYAGNKVRVRFVFDTVDNLNNNNYRGWYVDDIQVKEG